MDAAVERPLREAAIGSGDHILAAQSLRVADDALGNELGWLDDVGGVADDAWDQHFALWQFNVLPDLPLMFVARIGPFDQKGADIGLHQYVDDVLERHVRGVRAWPASPTDVIADPVSRNSLKRVIEHFDLMLQPFAAIGKARG